MSDRQRSSPAASGLPAHLELKATLLLVTLALLFGAVGLYLLYARGVFAETQTLVLGTDDSDGVVPGMDLTFSGFPIGRVRRIELAQDASVRIVVDVERDNAHWLRSSSVFTLERGIVGSTRIRAYSGIPDDPPLPPGARRDLLRGDVQAEIPRLVVSLRELVDNLKNATASDSPMAVTLGNLRALSDRFGQPGGVAGALLGDAAQADRLGTLLQRTESLLAGADRLVAQTERQLFGKAGVADQTQAAVAQLNRTLKATQDSLAHVDAVLQEAQRIAANARSATEDLDLLRAQVESSVRNADRLLDEVNRRLPFAREPRVRLP